MRALNKRAFSLGKVIEDFFSCICIYWYKHSRGWENSRQLCKPLKPSTSSRVCRSDSNSPSLSHVYMGRKSWHLNLEGPATGKKLKMRALNKRAFSLGKVIEDFFSCICIYWYKHSRGWENSRQLCKPLKPSTSSRVCRSDSNSPSLSHVCIRRKSRKKKIVPAYTLFILQWLLLLLIRGICRATGYYNIIVLFSRGLLQVWVSGRFKLIHFTTKVMGTHCMRNCHRDYLASVAIIITQLTFDRNENYLRYLIRMQQFPCRDRATPDNLRSPSKHSILWVSETCGK